MQPNENLAKTKKDGEFIAAEASFPILSSLLKQRSHVACLKKPLFLKVRDNQT